MPSDKYDSICYKRNFLAQVIARIDFVSPVQSIAKRLPKELSTRALEAFPIEEPKPTFMQQVKLTKDEVTSKKEEFTEWNFFGRNREKRLAITPMFLFITYTRYNTYEALRNDFIGIMETYLAVFSDAQPSRLGLRYVNHIEPPHHDNPLIWDTYINKKLLGLTRYSVKDAKPIRIFHNFEVAFSDFNLRFQFGLHNPDYPAPIHRPMFTLDYDASYNGLVDPGDIPSLLDKYHSAIQTQFETSIRPDLRSIMNEL
jgi:uncharacterized protein (TIGR04255 family)